MFRFEVCEDSYHDEEELFVIDRIIPHQEPRALQTRHEVAK